MIVNSSQKMSNFDSPKVNDNSGQKKRKLIINLNLSFKKSQKNFIKKAREDRMTKILLIVDGWDIAINDDYVNSLDSNINDVMNKIGLSNDDCDDMNN